MIPAGEAPCLMTEPWVIDTLAFQHLRDFRIDQLTDSCWATQGCIASLVARIVSEKNSERSRVKQPRDAVTVAEKFSVFIHGGCAWTRFKITLNLGGV